MRKGFNKLIFKKNAQGITLIALIITVIIMLILASVAISAVVSDDGLFDRTRYAKEIYENITEKENQILHDLMQDINTTLNELNPIADVNVKLTEGMVPVKYNKEDSSWYVATEEELKNNSWFSYIDANKAGMENQSKWANVMLRDGLIVEDITDAKIADLSEMYGKKVTREGSMYVWIPRYAYKIDTGYHTSTVGTISIKFLNTDNTFKSGGNETLYLVPDEEHNTSNSYVLHPAFNWEKEDGTPVALEGIWIGKFEASVSDANYTPIITDSSKVGNVLTSDSVILRSIGNVSSWRYISGNNIFLNCYNMNSENNANIYGISTNKDVIDPHMMKNIEWGAVAYLTHSAYGKNGKEIAMNSTGFDTGNGSYKTNVSMSTTGNVYGIYDMSGGAWERTSAYIDCITDENTSNTYLTSEEFAKSIYEADDKYKDVYEIALDPTNKKDNYNANSNKYGDAIFETSIDEINCSWNKDYSAFPDTTAPLFNRGGIYNSARLEYSGIFAFVESRGNVSAQNSFRSILTVL